MYHSPHSTETISAKARPSNDDVVPGVSLTDKNAELFGTPNVSGQVSRAPSFSNQASTTGVELMQQQYFRSRRVEKGTIERPWLDRKDPREKWVTIIPLIGILVGVAISAVLIWDGLRSVINHKYCEVLVEDFSGGLNENIWTKEVEVGGYGNGQFEMTTNTDENAFIDKDGVLVIKPTLQDASLIDRNNVVDLRNGSCTSDIWYNCIVSTNVTNGTIVNPVKSARLNTKLGASIKFGRVEVTAKLPAGDWLWPAIWMLPKDNLYGTWPKSGEIDIMECRGNNYTYRQGGNNIVSSTLHWGPNAANDGWWRNNAKRQALRTTYAAGYHTFGLEWSEKYIFTYIDTRLLQVMYTHLNKPFWYVGQFPLSDSNGTRLVDPWGFTGNPATPFDQDFYLVLNVAVGGTNGWFKDGVFHKPWVDTSQNSRKDFWAARDSWYPTWKKNGQMKIKSVKMWQQAGYNGCK